MIKLGSTIKYVRETKALTQRAAAATLGVSDVHLCNLERDRARPSADLIAKIHKEWSVDVYILAWCLHGDTKKLPKAVRAPMEQLAEAWRTDLEKQRILKRT